jgi:hypothetical protein
MAVCLTATKFEPFVFSVLGFAFAYVSKIHIIMILYDFCLLPCYINVNIRNLERQMCGSVCALVSYQRCRGLYFGGAAIPSDGCSLQTSRLDRHKSFWI